MTTLSIRRWLLLAWLITAIMGNGLFDIAGPLVSYAWPQNHAPWVLTQLVPELLLVLTFFAGASWFLGRMVLRPLAAMSRAARQIAGGDLNFKLPPSRVQEVAEVSAAFHAMGNALREALERQSELEQERRLFITAIAHDLRTPLFSLRGHLEGLERGLATTPEKRARYIAVCQEKADALERLITDLFAYARMEYLEQGPRREPLEMGTLLGRVVESLRSQAEAKGVTLQLDASEETRTLHGDAKLLERVVENLLNNALRHTPAGGSVKVSWRAEPDRLLFSVSDTGAGIAPCDLPHLFAPLYRGETSRNPQTGGAGLGLAIARSILLAHGGELTAANRANGGAEFTGSLPYLWKMQP
jgi:signal transduction histidine kinase